MNPRERDAAFKGYLRLIGRTSRVTQPKADVAVAAPAAPATPVVEIAAPLSSYVDAVTKDIFDERDVVAARQASDEKKLWDGG